MGETRKEISKDMRNEKMNFTRRKVNTLKTTKGITLIALVITIIVLLILAGVTIATLTGENGILTQANNAKIEQSHGAVAEAIGLAYNEWQIELNTANNSKVASTQTTIIKGKEEKAKANTSTTFLDFLTSKGYIKNETTDVLDVKKLTGGKQALGNGTDNDVYKIKEELGKYAVYYYDKNNTPQEIWSIAKQALESDEGKEALVLVYEVPEEDLDIKLPYKLEYTYYDKNEEKRIEANYNFKVDWGDGQSNDITNANIEDLGAHIYDKAGTYEVTITGNYNILCNERSSVRNLKEIKQWGTTGLVITDLTYVSSLQKISSPTENSFINLIKILFPVTDITNIPENLFANCPNIKDFNDTFNQTSITSIPENLFANCSNVTSFDNTFGYTGITDIPESLFANCPNVTSFNYTFGNTEITNIPENLFANCPNVTDFSYTFYDTSITSIPENLFANVDWNKVTSFKKCFTNCRNLTGKAPDLWLNGTNSEENNYQGTPDGLSCFTGCEGLDNYTEIPAYWKADLEEN